MKLFVDKLYVTYNAARQILLTSNPGFLEIFIGGRSPLALPALQRPGDNRPAFACALSLQKK